MKKKKRKKNATKKNQFPSSKIEISIRKRDPLQFDSPQSRDLPYTDLRLGSEPLNNNCNFCKCSLHLKDRERSCLEKTSLGKFASGSTNIVFRDAKVYESVFQPLTACKHVGESKSVLHGYVIHSGGRCLIWKAYLA